MVYVDEGVAVESRTTLTASELAVVWQEYDQMPVVQLNWNPELKPEDIAELCRKGFGEKYIVGLALGTVRVSEGPVVIACQLIQDRSETKIRVRPAMPILAT